MNVQVRNQTDRSVKAAVTQFSTGGIGSIIDLNTMLGLAAGAPTPCTRLRFKGNSNWRVANTGTVWLGWTNTANNQPVEILPGETVVIDAPTGQFLDTKDINVESEFATDGLVVVLYR